ncbi:MAG: HAD family hydrolase [Gammaproteobacteria bacterium]|nr:HAD family hydrolase [Gammaproteobacteria bacterium]
MSTDTHLTITPPKLLIFDWQGTLADNSGDLFSGVRETLDILKKNNFIVALATSMPREYIDVLLQENHIENYFTMIQTGDMGYQKPDPQMLHAILQATHHTASDALMIGDSLADVVMANDAGIAAVTVLSGSDTKIMLEMAKPLLILESINELPNLLKLT